MRQYTKSTVSSEIYDVEGGEVSSCCDALIKPVGYRILIKCRSKEEMEKTEGGIILVDKAVNREAMQVSEGVVVEMGSKAFEDFPEKPEIGDKIAFKAYEATYANDDGSYRYLSDKSVLGVKLGE